ncbi:hypothetical protein CHU98_g11872 [Xylaria longipes]|nr:hypothetical protein CHU98_g11872 [Xylaria longipes]
MILAVSLALFWWTMYRDNTPRTTRTQVRNHGEESRPMPDISMARTTTTTTTTTTSMAFVEVPTVGKDCEDEESGAAQSTTKTPDAPPPLPGRETAIACSLSADLAQLNQQDPSLVSLYDLSQLPLLVLFHGTSTLPPSYISLLSPGTQARSSNSKNKTKKKQGGKSKAAEEARIVLAAENIPQAVLVQGFASAINERWRELEMACGGGRGGTGTGIRKSSDSDDDMLLKPTLDVTMNNSTQSAGTGVGARDDNSKDVSHRRYYKKRDDGDARYGNARHGENRNREDAPLCLSLEGRSLHKRHELTIKTAAFLTNPAHRKLYNAKFQRRVEALRVLQTQEQGRERDRRGDKTASASCDDKKYDIYGGKEGNKRIRKKAHDTTGKTGGYLGRLWNTGGSSGNADVGNGNERRDGEGSSQVNGGHRRDLDEANPPFEEVCAGVV